MRVRKPQLPKIKTVKDKEVDSLSVDYRIKEVFKKTGFTLTGFAKAQGKCFQSLSRKINHGQFTVGELMELATITGCEFQCCFALSNGERLYLYDEDLKGEKIMKVDYNAQIYEKMKAEQDKYTNWLLSQEPAEILNHTYEYTMREDIVMCIENLDLSPKRAKALLKSPCPLDDVFKEFRDREVEHMDTIRDSIETRADTVIKREKNRESR